MNQFAIPSQTTTFREAQYHLRNYLKARGIRSLLLGLSGGADSVLTLHLLIAATREIAGFQLGVAHANFNLRGEESKRDENFVIKLQEIYEKREGITFFYRNFNTKEYAERNNLSIEMAARALRHDWWDNLRSDYGYTLIATGHNADDNEETLMLNLFRGSSPRGLRAMSTLGDRIFRPLLGLNRRDILSLLRDFYKIYNIRIEGFPEGYVTDSSNLSCDYRRNFLRNKIIPLLAEEWEGLHKALQTDIDFQKEAADINDYFINKFLVDHRVAERKQLKWDELKSFPAPTTLLYYWLHPYGATKSVAREIASHIPTGNDLTKMTGTIWKLSEDKEILASTDGLQIRESLPYEIRIPESSDWIRFNSGEISADSIKKAGKNEIYVPHSPENYEWRRTSPGDRIRLFSADAEKKRSKLVSDVMREAGLTLSQRESFPLLINKNSGEIIWIPGIRRAGYDLISPESREIFYLKWPK